MTSSTPKHHLHGFHDNNITALTDRLLLDLAERLHHDDYRRLGLRLGFSEIRLQGIEHSRQGAICESIYHMLTEWKRREGNRATILVLIQSVRDCGNSEAADWLETETGLCEQVGRAISVEEKLNEGNVPALPDCLTERTEELSELRDKLRQAASSDKPERWVVVHGMGGMGKTVLANQAVRDQQLIEEFFQDGVFWLYMGNVKDVSSIPDRLETICRIFDSNLSSAPSPPKTVEQWKHLLSKLISQRYPRCLLVLDDVWIPAVVSAFDVKCTILITTRDSGVTNRVPGHKEEINLSQGLSEAQSNESLAEWTSTPITNLPPQAATIHSLSHGSPLVIAIVGALLRDFPDRWNFYASQMEASKTTKLTSDSSYEYRSVYDAMEMSLEQLSELQMAVYSWFAAFDKGTQLSCKVLAMLSECSKEEVEDRMMVIMQRSLVSSEWCAIARCRVYWLHDLLHDHLVARNAGNEKPRTVCNEFKCLLAMNQFKSCRANLVATALQFPMSTCVFKRGHHLAASSGQLCLIETLIGRTDTRPLVHLIRHGKSGRAVRNALLCPTGKEVVSTDLDGKLQVSDVLSGDVRLTIEAHRLGITTVSISPDGTLAATCSEDRSLCVWDIRTNKMRDGKTACGDGLGRDRLVKQLTHDGVRICRCVFTIYRKQHILVSADETGCIKVWDANFMLICSIKAHQTAIRGLDVNHGEGYILTVAKNHSTVKVFSLQSGEQKFELDHDDEVQDVAYLGNGLIVTATWCELQVFNSSRRRLCTWSECDPNATMESISTCACADGQLLAIFGRDGIVTVLKMGITFLVSRKLSIFCRLKIGGIFRRVTDVSLAVVSRGKPAKESVFLTTAQDCGLVLVWNLAKKTPPVTVNHALYDVSFKPSGEFDCLIGAEHDGSKNIAVMRPECNGNVQFSSYVFKAAEDETIMTLQAYQSTGKAGIYTDRGAVKIVKLPLSGKTWSSPKKSFDVIEPSESKLLLCKLLSDGHEVLTVTTGAQICVEIWSTDKQGSILSSRCVNNQGLSADLSRDETALVVGCADGTALLFTLLERRLSEGEVTSLKGPSSRASHVEFSADGSLLLMRGWKQLVVFDAKTRQEVCNLMENVAFDLAKFSPDGSMILTVSGKFLKTLFFLWSNQRVNKDLICESKSCFLFTCILFTRVSIQDVGFLNWYKIGNGTMNLLFSFRVNSRVHRVSINSQFTVFVTVDEAGQIYVLKEGKQL
ncbi:uncharacterized protein [Diadema antillarum]|uniref:uncharacterized protein n=1 Tax=Diadema antillarum TaxID=105358 RepID=UPI003A8B72BF